MWRKLFGRDKTYILESVRVSAKLRSRKGEIMPASITKYFRNGLGYFLMLPGGILLYILSRANYHLFHGLVEILSVIFAGVVTIIAWNSRYLVRRHFLLFIGLGYPFIALLGILHTFSFKGLSVFPAEYGVNLTNQLWIAARYLECLTFVVAPIFLARRLRPGAVLAGYTLVIVLILATIFVWPVFPVCYVEGLGLTTFKKTSEFLISLIWLLVIYALLHHRKLFDPPVLLQLLLAVVCNIIAGLSFTISVDIYGLINFFGHFLRIIALYFLYRAIIEKSLNDPYRSLFREVHMSDQHFRSLYETAPLAFVVWDENCLVTQWNKTAEKIFGWSAAEVKGKDFFEFLVPKEDRPAVADVVDALHRGTLANRSVNANLTKSGETLICEWNNSILRDEDGNFRRVLSLGLDITEQKKAEEVLQQQSEMIKRFAYSVAHDLKNPAESLSGLAGLFRRKYGDALDNRGRLICDQMKQVSEDISELVQNINTYVVSKELPLEVETIDLQVLLGLLREEFAGRVAERQLDWVEPDVLPKIRADKTALRRVIQNFVDNALKYGGKDLSRIEIGYRETPEHHLLYVRDDGVGLPLSEEDKIFDIFQRGQTASGTSGAGLGLAITRELAEKMGGKVWIESPDNHGATFFVSISRSF